MKIKLKLRPVEKEKDKRLSTVVGWCLNQRQGFMIISWWCLISIHFIHLLFKSIISVSPQLTENIPKTLMVQTSKRKSQIQHLVKLNKISVMLTMKFKYPLATQPPETLSSLTFSEASSKSVNLSKVKWNPRKTQSSTNSSTSDKQLWSSPPIVCTVAWVSHLLGSMRSLLQPWLPEVVENRFWRRRKLPRIS